MTNNTNIKTALGLLSPVPCCRVLTGGLVLLVSVDRLAASDLPANPENRASPVYPAK